MPILHQIAIKIIKEQELIIGPLAWIEASKVVGLKIIDQKRSEVEFSGDPKTVIDGLVNQYKRLFGKASQEVCQDASRQFISSLSPTDIPVTLK